PERILVVDDEQNTVRVFARLLEGEGYRVLAAESAEAALAILAEGPVDAAILDHRMPGDSGLDLARAILAGPDAPIVILATGFGDVEQAVEAMKAGVYDYLIKPVSFDNLRILLARALGERRLARENADLRTRLRERGRTLEARLGESRAMEEVYRTVYAVADSDATVLIQGETGSGKELIARAIHDLSSRADKPLVKIDCGAVPPELMESELFGHERGAFTGAHARKIGRIEAAAGGTVFLDELGNLPERMQGGLLRVLESREFERVGGLSTLRVDVRFLVATKDDLERKVALGAFREDLYYRLSSIPIRLPPLRERTDQIPHLLGRFLVEFAEKAGKAVSGFDPEALDLLTAYSWPGNVRELRN
ncbi:MAG: sigma-54 dependent transcriptional regulator, partial [Candidatus Methylomirabilis sp.]|nr:sigma-54 dependent transcriptional regulator [Deltaproteobacteria bacterium]